MGSFPLVLMFCLEVKLSMKTRDDMVNLERTGWEQRKTIVVFVNQTKTESCTGQRMTTSGTVDGGPYKQGTSGTKLHVSEKSQVSPQRVKLAPEIRIESME